MNSNEIYQSYKVLVEALQVFEELGHQHTKDYKKLLKDIKKTFNLFVKAKKNESDCVESFGFRH